MSYKSNAKVICCIILINCSCYAINQDKNFDANKDMQIIADHAKFDENNGTAMYTGHVKSNQGSRILTSDTLEIIRDKDNNKIKEMIAHGSPANIQAAPAGENKLHQGRAEIIKYYPDTDQMELIGSAEIFQNKESIKGEHLIYDFEKELLKNHQSSSRITTTISNIK